jgi:Zn-dependent M28 family amino/carboxypeptidase
MWNVVGEQNWKNAKVRVVLLAHWDTRPTADMEPEPADRRKPIIGANDGASGVAVLLELMRVMKGRNPDLGIQYLFVDGEDLGPDLDEMFLGARHYVKNLPSPRPQYGILLDMIGDKDLTVPIEYNSYVAARSVVNALYRHAATVDLKAAFPNVVGQAIDDDHLSLIAAGIPTVDLIDFTYPSWHTLQDTPDKCSPESLGKVGKLLETFLTKSPPFNPAEN